MHHVAIMKKSWNLIPKIVSGKKTIESRWYRTRRAPWDGAKAGDTVFFKNAGEPITAKARISKVLQFELKRDADAIEIVHRYGKKICLRNTDPVTWEKMPRYCILLFLEYSQEVKPFQIIKKGFWHSKRVAYSFRHPNNKNGNKPPN